MNVFRMEEEHEEKQYMDDAGSRADHFAVVSG